MSLTPVDPGHLAAIVTSLEMTRRPSRSPHIASDLRLEPMRRPQPEAYRALFRLVGSEWLWFSRLVIDEDALRAIIHDDAVEIFAVKAHDGTLAGMLELDFRDETTCELSFVGLAPDFVGLGHGRWLIVEALTRAWRPDISRVWVHTCTLDHPGAMAFYIANGFAPFARAVEIFADPRLTGHLPRDAAPHVPLIG